MRYRGINYSRLLKNNQRCRKQYKVHRAQMSKYDIQNLVQILKNIDLNSMRTSYHVIKKNDDRLTIELFRDTFARNMDSMEDKIIEYNEIPYFTKYGMIFDKRVLIRDDKDYDGYNLCLVLSINRNQIVTAYWTHKDDNHANLDWSRYSNTYYISVC